ncbi:two-component system sensor protein [gamma proteobacterium HTCC5015]|nr:two-component system sensor protein [gamma proteobacterium HTCC5015]
MFPNPPKRSNLRSKLTRVFVLQIILISALTAAGVYVAKLLVEDVLVREALVGEAEYFWSKYEENPNQAMPDTLNLMSYMAAVDDLDANIPSGLRELNPGLHRVQHAGQQPIIYVEDKHGMRLYLIFDEDSVSKLALLFGILPLAMVLVVLYLLAWLAYRQANRAVSPIVHLANHVESMDFREGHWQLLDVDSFDVTRNTEVYSMVTAINHFIERLHQFVERERLFTRDASHELRTPIAVLKGALEVLDRKYEGVAEPIIDRMHRTLKDMEGLTETLLLLARDESDSLDKDNVNIAEIVRHELKSLELIHKGKRIDTEVLKESELTVWAPEKVVVILVGNLLRNAFNYTPEGRISVTLHDRCLVVSDSGIGMKKEQLKAVTKPFYRAGSSQESPGHGLGMAIVQRLCSRYQWELSITSSYGEGTKVRVDFG